MKRQERWKKAGALLLAAAIFGSGSFRPESGLIVSRAQTRTVSLLTEYDAETLEKFRDNTLEYWEIPGLIQEYNPDFKSQLAAFYYNPDGSTGLTKDQLLSIAADLREEAAEIRRTAEDDKNELTKIEYENSLANARVLRAKAQDLEDAAKGKSAAGAASIRSMRLLRDQTTKTARELMRNLKLLDRKAQTTENAVTIAELALEGADRRKELGLCSGEEVLNARQALDSARAEASAAQTEYLETKQTLIRMLGWSYDADPVIGTIPEPDLAKIAGFDPEKDEARAIETNMCLYDTRMTASGSQGGADSKARTIKTQENEVRMKLSFLYQDVLQKQASYEAAKLKFAADQAARASADRKKELGMISEKEYLAEENTWLSAQTAMDQAAFSLTAAIEEYEWALQGLLQLDTTVQTS